MGEAAKQEPTVWSVEVHDYDECTHLGFFTSAEAAAAYCEDYNEFADADRWAKRAVVVEYATDEPRAALRGAWYAVVGPDGAVLSTVRSPIFTPGEGAREVGPGYDNIDRRVTPLRQGFGVTEEAAIAAARASSPVEPTGAAASSPDGERA